MGTRVNRLPGIEVLAELFTASHGTGGLPGIIQNADRSSTLDGWSGRFSEGSESGKWTRRPVPRQRSESA
jgi:hypothetical protein